MQKPLVSVVIPTYNRTAYLKLTLESIQNQTFQDFEVIVVDDGTPTEENRLLCEQYEKVQYIKIENSGGPAKPRNEGIKLAKGKYFTFVDDDDIWLPTKLEKQVAILEQNPDFGLVHGCCEIIDENGVLQNKIVGRPGTPEVKHGDVKLRMMGNWTVMMSTSFVRKEVVDKVGFFNEAMPAAGEDVEFWTRCSFETKFYYFEEPLVNYRIHTNNISKQTGGYINLPLYLKLVLDHYNDKNKVSINEFQYLKDSLCFMQLKQLNRTNFKVVLSNVFKLSKMWFLKKNNIKVFIKRLVKK
jgi:glycosyltransferase involved in cell wall biosynthesis